MLLSATVSVAQIPNALLTEPREVIEFTDVPPVCYVKNNIDVQSTEVSGPTSYIPQNFDVLHYNVYLNLMKLPALKLDTVHCVVTFVWTSTPDTFRFHLRGLIPDAIQWKSATQTTYKSIPFTAFGVPAQPNFHYTVAATPDMKTGDTIQMSITYSGTMTQEVGGGNWGGVQVDGKGVYAMGVGFKNNYVSATQHWMPCYDHPSDKATFEGVFVTKNNYTVASNGLLQSRTVVDDTTVVYHWKMNDPCATYLMTFAADEYVPVNFTGMSKPAVVYSRVTDTAATRKSFSLLPRVLAMYERYFGAYPHEKIGYANTQKGSMEHQSMVCVAKSISQSRDTVNQNGFHELAHQWFGDLVTPYDFRDAWLTESFATYCETLWHQELFGNAGYIAEMQRKINRFLAVLGKPGGPGFEGILPLYNFPRASPSSNYPETIYQKGAAVLGMLRYHVGDSAFFATLRSYLDKHAFGNATIDTMQQAFESFAPAEKKSSIKPFFDEWVRGRGWCTVNIDALKLFKDGRWQGVLNITQVQSDTFGVNGLFTAIPLEVTFTDAAGNKIHRVITITSKTKEYTLDSLNDFTDVNINKGNAVRSLVLLSKSPVITTVDDTTPLTTIQAYPTPASSVVWYSIPTEGTYKLQVTNYLGQEVAHSLVRSQSGELHALDVLALQNGVYQCTLSGDATHSTFPIIIAR